ncbi:MAG TPA: hypothetical protein VIY48_02130 [Candidatus Paceibacterota bacterium]
MATKNANYYTLDTNKTVAEISYKKLDLAIELLDEAIRQFLDRKSFACFLNLAGVAEEVLGRTVELRGGESSLAQRVNDHLLIHNAFASSKLTAKQSRDRQNRAKNSIKHLNDTNDAEVTLDLEDEAIEMLNRAVHNVILLQLPYTDEIRRFDDWYMENCVGV